MKRQAGSRRSAREDKGGARARVRVGRAGEPGARARLIAAARDLLQRHGYAATSPRDIQRAAGAGQGSFYHHFSGKAELAAEALKAEVAELAADCDRLLTGPGSPMARVRSYLMRPREGLNGCRVGRQAFDPGMAETALRKVVSAYFGHLEARLTDTLEAARAQGELLPAVRPAMLAATIAATVQGGYILSRATGDPAAMDRATGGLLALLDAVRGEGKA